MEHLRIDHQQSPVVGEGIRQSIFHYVWVRGRCSLIELFPIFARKEGFLVVLEQLLSEKKLTTDLKSIWAREKQIVFSETPLSYPDDRVDEYTTWVLNNQVHYVGKDFTHAGVININRDFQLQWHKMTLKPGDAFYLGHFDDFRGRKYPKGHILTYQGTDFQKNLVRGPQYEVDASHPTLGDLLREQILMDDVRPENMTPRMWLRADMARSYGLDKATWAERLVWAQNHPRLEAGAKEPFSYVSAHAASNAATTDHLVSLDATASGIQCLSLMAQDAASAEAVNLGTDHVNNPYQRVKDDMGEGYPYEKVKKAVMTSFYESIKTPRDLFGDEYEKFMAAASKMLPGPWALMQAISSCMNNREFYSWTMMDGYQVNMEVTSPIECRMDIGGMDMVWTEHRRAPVATKGLTANVTHSLDALVLREVIRRTNVVSYAEWNDNVSSELREQDVQLAMSVIRWRQSGFVSFEFLEHMDELNGGLVPQELRVEIDQRAATADMYIQPIHDCYRVRAVDAGQLFIIVREVMADLAYAKTAQWLLPQLGYKGAINDVESKRASLRAQVLRSQYLIC